MVPGELRESVVVVTGASSGIGRAASLEFARRGAKVVVVARRAEPLRDLAAQCETLGASALAVPTDVSKERAVQDLARRAVERFGRLDVWVNNAAVTAFGLFDQLPPDVFRRVIEVDLFGYVYGARTALSYFKAQGSGVLINNASVAGQIGQPYASAYVTAKFGIVGFSKALRQELRGQKIRVCTLLPGPFDTPLFQHAANYSGRAPKPLNPTYDAEEVARTIASLAEHPRDEVVVGYSLWTATIIHRILPGLVERLTAEQVERDHFLDRPAQPTEGNLFEPMPQWTGVSGGWKAPGTRPSTVRRLASIGLAALVPAALGWLWLRPQRR